MAFSFEPPNCYSGPFERHIELGHLSYAEIGVRQNSDGTWAIDTGDQFLGYCGHGGPYHGAWPSFEKAIWAALLKLAGHFSAIIEARDSVCTDKNRVMARKGLTWVRSIADEFHITIDIAGQKIRAGEDA